MLPVSLRVANTPSSWSYQYSNEECTFKSGDGTFVLHEDSFVQISWVLLRVELWHVVDILIQILGALLHFWGLLEL